MAKKSLPTTDMMDSADDFEVLYTTNAPLIYRFMFWRTRDAMLSEDLTSNVFEKAWRSRASFSGGSSKAWLYKIAHNTLIDHWRKKQTLPLDDEAAAQIVNDTAAPAEVLDRDSELADLRRAVDKLPADMRSVVQLRFIDGLSGRQTAERLAISEANVRVIQYRALRKLRGYLQ